MTALLEIEGVTKRFGRHEVLGGIDLAVAEGEVICLIGASGSGKSTLLRCINLTEPVSGGQIRLAGQELIGAGVSHDGVRRQIGIVFQSYNLFPHMTVLRNVTLALREVVGQSRTVADARARALLARIGLEDKCGEYPDRLSGGQQQRVAMVRALALEPRLMLLDEVTSALDPVLIADVLDLVRELADGGMTMVIATHEMSFAREIADRVCFLEGGRIVEEGPPERMFRAPSDPRTRAFLARVIAARRM